MSQRRADALLVLIAVIWGTTFTVVHESVESFPAFALIALRFGCASVVFLPSLVRNRGALQRSSLAVGALLGALLFIGFATQTSGLRYTTPARAGFITGLNVVLVPLLGLFWGQRPPWRASVGVAFALVGLTIMSWAGISSQQQWLGDTLVLLCAFAFAMHIVAVGQWATQLPVVVVNTVQLVVVTVLAGLASLMFERPLFMPTVSVMAAAAYLGLVATALVFAMQLKLQRYTSATHTALIFALEPVFAALFSWLWTGEQITLAIAGGGGLMLLGVIVAEVPWTGRLISFRNKQSSQRVVLDGEP